jgi:fructose-1,6-bisphosphatase II
MSAYTNQQILGLLRVATEAAARAAFERIGCGMAEGAEGAANEAMLESLAELPFAAVVVVGEGGEQEGAKLYAGQILGNSKSDLQFDLAADPGEGTTYLAEGLTNAMSVAALAPRGTMFVSTPALYMEKFAAPRAARREIDPSWSVEKKLMVLSKVLGKEMHELTIFVQEKPRHRALIEKIREIGADVTSFPAGDVAGALLATLPDSGIDALMGTGGVREGIISACAARALGAVFQARLDPQLQSEQAAVRAAALDVDRWYSAEDLVTSADTLFCATGITSGLLLEGVERLEDRDRVQTLMIAGSTGENQILTTWRRFAAEV